jgi:hypothetical protein
VVSRDTSGVLPFHPVQIFSFILGPKYSVKKSVVGQIIDSLIVSDETRGRVVFGIREHIKTKRCYSKFFKYKLVSRWILKVYGKYPNLCFENWEVLINQSISQCNGHGRIPAAHSTDGTSFSFAQMSPGHLMDTTLAISTINRGMLGSTPTSHAVYMSFFNWIFYPSLWNIKIFFQARTFLGVARGIMISMKPEHKLFRRKPYTVQRKRSHRWKCI